MTEITSSTRVKIFRVPERDLVLFFSMACIEECKEGILWLPQRKPLPSGTKVERCNHNYLTRTFDFLLSNDAWPEVEQGTVPPDFGSLLDVCAIVKFVKKGEEKGIPVYEADSCESEEPIIVS
jgi:hypothetical protein